MDYEDILQICMNKKTNYTLSATDISRYVESPFFLYCHNFVSESEKDTILDLYLEKLIEIGNMHESRINNEMFPNLAPLVFKTPKEGFSDVLQQMISGAPAILNAPLYFLPKGLYGTTDQLVKENGSSSFGEYHYIVKEIKSAKTIKEGHKLQAALYNYVIGKIQNYIPETFYIINMEKQVFPFKFTEYEDKLSDIIEKVFQLKGGERPTPTFDSCRYPWKDYCNRMAIEEKDVSILPNVGPKMKSKLVEAGYPKLDDVVRIGKQKLLEIKGIGGKTGNVMFNSAKAILSNEILCIGPPKSLPHRSTEIFFDLEGIDPITIMHHKLDMTDYLIGTLVRKDDGEEYFPFIAKDVNSEEEMMHKFIEFIKKQEDYILYHWHHYEKTHMKKMMDKYNISDDEQCIILHPDVLCDLHPVVTSSYVFPIPGTSIKSIAKLLGYEWKHQDVGAMSSIGLYFQYINDPVGSSKSLDMILDYNKDDCVATRVIKDWYVKQNNK